VRGREDEQRRIGHVGRNAGGSDMSTSKDDTILALWEARLRERGLMPKTIAKKMNMTRAAMAYARDHNWPEDPAKFGEAEIEAYRKSLSNRAYPTQMFHLGNLNQFVNWARSKGSQEGDR